MRLLTKATVALPVMVLLLGVVVPVLMQREQAAMDPAAGTVEPTLSGRTAGEWAEQAQDALERGQFREALASIKTAENVAPGAQYDDALDEIRRAKWRAGEVGRARARMLEGSIDGAAFSDDGVFVGGSRVTPAMPGESLWTLARSLVAAEREALPSELPRDDPDVYAAWDALTALNGVRELEVGEQVKLPISPHEREALALANGHDLERLAAAADALDGGDLDLAVERRAVVTGDFALATDECLGLDEEIRSATEKRAATMLSEQALSAASTNRFGLADSLAAASLARGGSEFLIDRIDDFRLAREHELVETARGELARVGTLDRAHSHAERLAALGRTRDALNEAELLRDTQHYADATELVERMAAEESRFRVRDDGTIVALKPAGVPYTEAARAAVEWLLERRLEASGRSFPQHHLKTVDETAWARYLIVAAEDAKRGGVDFATLLEATGREVELTLPDPVAFFAD